MKLSIEPVVCNAQVEALLAASGLPVEDLGERPQLHLFGARFDGKLAGVVGVEVYRDVGLLRSLAVEPAFRKLGYAHALVAHAEFWASQLGVDSLYLLTTTAAGFFARLDYAPLPRSDAPQAIAKTTQFAGLCPASATFMRKQLAVDRPEA